MKNDLAARARDLALRLTRKPSVTGTRDEAEYAEWLAGELTGFDKVWTTPVPGGVYPRKNLFALKQGRSKKTVVLTGHFDVVPADDYGALPAFEPEKLLVQTISRLRLTGENPKALADFESGEFLPGRGLLDMKAGLAAGLAAIETYRGDMTLLFIAVADEENRSAGARAAVPVLKSLDLDVRLVINLDSISDQGDGGKARVVTWGSIGKQLLTAFVVGKETHAGYPRDGVNAAYIAAELIREFELAPELGETTGDEVAGQPTALYAKDLKQGYNVTTPGSAFVYWNTLQHRRSAAEVLSIASDLAARAIGRVAEKTGRHVGLMTFKQLASRVPDFSAVPDQSDSLPDHAREVTQALWRASGLTAPTVVLGFGSIPYRPVYLRDEELKNAIAMALKPHGVGELNYFAGISDMSFFGEAAGDFSVEEANTPMWRTSFEAPESAGYPTVNIGPWGRDYHHWLERLHAPYAFETLPCALFAVIDAVSKSR